MGKAIVAVLPTGAKFIWACSCCRLSQIWWSKRKQHMNVEFVYIKSYILLLLPKCSSFSGRVKNSNMILQVTEERIEEE